MFWKSRIDWKVRAMPRETIACGRRPTRLPPSRRMSPSSGRSSPVIRLKTVVFPAPFGPMSPTIPPAGITRSTSLTATRPPNRRVSPRTSSTGAPAFPWRGLMASRSHPGTSSARRRGAPPARRRARPVLLPLVHGGGGWTQAPAHQAFRADQHDDDQAETEEEPAPQGEIDTSEDRDVEGAADPAHEEGELGEDDTVEQRDEHAAQDHAFEAAHAAQHDHAEEHDRHVEFEGARRDGLELGRVEGSREAGEGRAQGEGEELGLDRAHPGAVGRRLVLSDGHSGAAEARVAHAVHGPQRERADDEDEEVPGY